MDQRFELDNFAGPLDLLLYLVQKEELDIREISLVRICDQYLEQIKALEKRDIERAGEFFLMAATLMSIKARSLLPREELDLDQELDPEEELIQKLLEYRQIKEASRDLSRSAEARSLVHVSRPLVTDAGIPLEEVGLFDLVEAFRKVLAETGLDRTSGTITADRPMAAYIQDLLDRLRSTPRMSFLAVFKGSGTRADLIGFFLALLELIRQCIVHAVQMASFGEIQIEAIGEVPERVTWDPEASASSGSAEEPTGLRDTAQEEQALEEQDELGSEPED